MNDSDILDFVIKDIFAIIFFKEGLDSIEEFDNFITKQKLPKKLGHQGLKFLFRCIQEQHLQELGLSFNLRLDVSETFLDTHHLDRRKRPTSSHVGALVRNAYEKFVKLQKCKNTSEMHSVYESEISDYLKALRIFYESNVILQPDCSPFSSLEYLKQTSLNFFIDTLFNSARSQLLNQYLSPTGKYKEKHKYVESIWSGYTTSVAFLISKIYGSFISGGAIDAILSSKNERELWKVGEKLEALNESIMTKNYGDDIPRFNLKEKVDLSPLEPYLVSQFMNLPLKENEELDALFEYNEVKIVDCRSKYFAGPATLCRLIRGELSFKSSSEDPVKMIRFKHPSPDEEGKYFFSFGILISASHPGWLIFEWCGNDYYTGNSTSNWLAIENEIETHGTSISIQEKEISFEELREYVLENSLQHMGGIKHLTEEESLRVLFDITKQLSEDIAGLMLEFIVCVLLARMDMQVSWAIRDDILKDAEIDIVAIHDRTCWLMECSHRLSADDMDDNKELVSEIKTKVDALSKMEQYKDLEIQPFYVTRQFHLNTSNMNSAISYIESEGIHVIAIENLIHNADLHQKDADRIISIVKKLDSWRPKAWTTGNEVLDVLRSYELRNYATPGLIQIPTEDIDEEDYQGPEK